MCPLLSQNFALVANDFEKAYEKTASCNSHDKTFSLNFTQESVDNTQKLKNRKQFRVLFIFYNICY